MVENHCVTQTSKRMLSCVATSVLRILLLHVVAFSKKLPWLTQTKVIFLKTQLHAVNACWKRLSQLSLTSLFYGTEYVDSSWLHKNFSLHYRTIFCFLLFYVHEIFSICNKHASLIAKIRKQRITKLYGIGYWMLIYSKV